MDALVNTSRELNSTNKTTGTAPPNDTWKITLSSLGKTASSNTTALIPTSPDDAPTSCLAVLKWIHIVSHLKMGSRMAAMLVARRSTVLFPLNLPQEYEISDGTNPNPTELFMACNTSTMKCSFIKWGLAFSLSLLDRNTFCDAVGGLMHELPAF
jgi:hypothetical protein